MNIPTQRITIDRFLSGRMPFFRNAFGKHICKNASMMHIHILELNKTDFLKLLEEVLLGLGIAHLYNVEKEPIEFSQKLHGVPSETKYAILHFKKKYFIKIIS